MQIQVAQTTVTQKTVEVTNQLTALIEKAQSTQKPVRITFDNDVSVIIGSEHKELLLKDYTLVSLDVTDNTTNASLGIISPKRVDYSKTINTLKL